jgi:ATP-dependent RNA helicase DOB1
MIPLVDPIENMGIKDSNIQDDIKQLESLENRYKTHPIRTRKDFANIYKNYERRLEVQRDFQQAKLKYTNAQKLVQSEELTNRKRVLRRLRYATEQDTITDKVRSYPR